MSRGKNFDQDLKLDVSSSPGRDLKSTDSTSRATAKDTQLTIDAAKDTALGEHMVSIVATPAREGGPTKADIKVEIKTP